MHNGFLFGRWYWPLLRCTHHSPNFGCQKFMCSCQNLLILHRDENVQSLFQGITLRTDINVNWIITYVAVKMDYISDCVIYLINDWFKVMQLRWQSIFVLEYFHIMLPNNFVVLVCPFFSSQTVTFDPITYSDFFIWSQLRKKEF